jgi:hypothetical protein
MPIMLCKRIIPPALPENSLHILCRLVMDGTDSTAVTDYYDYALVTDFWVDW